MKRETFNATDGKVISIAVWETENPKAVVQISHGMSEHIERYDDFAGYLSEKGFIVIGDDHRGHGKTDENALGLAEEGKDLFASTVSDMAELTDLAKERYNLPVLLLGHSYGSFLAQEYLQKHSDKIIGCVLSGSALYSGFVSGFGKFVANRKFKKHANEPGQFFANITFKSYDKHFGGTLNEWLSSNSESNEKYNADPFCGFTCSNGFYKYFFEHLNALAKGSFDSVKKELPILVAYGSLDYVGDRGKLIKPLMKKLEKSGLKPVEKVYESARHEILNETNRDEVYADIADFFGSII